MFIRLFIALMVLAPVLRASRVKDMSFVSGGRSNQLIGYGIVVGLAGDGDSNAVTTLRSVANILQRNGLTVDPTQIKAKNSAAVMITADIPPFLKPGARIDVTVSSMGDAKSLQGGVLLQAPLLGADGRVYAVAQGGLAVGGFIGGIARRQKQARLPPEVIEPRFAVRWHGIAQLEASVSQCSHHFAEFLALSRACCFGQ